MYKLTKNEYNFLKEFLNETNVDKKCTIAILNTGLCINKLVLNALLKFICKHSKSNNDLFEFWKRINHQIVDHNALLCIERKLFKYDPGFFEENYTEMALHIINNHSKGCENKINKILSIIIENKLIAPGVVILKELKLKLQENPLLKQTKLNFDLSIFERDLTKIVLSSNDTSLKIQLMIDQLKYGIFYLIYKDVLKENNNYNTIKYIQFGIDHKIISINDCPDLVDSLFSSNNFNFLAISQLPGIDLDRLEDEIIKRNIDSINLLFYIRDVRLSEKIANHVSDWFISEDLAKEIIERL